MKLLVHRLDYKNPTDINGYYPLPLLSSVNDIVDTNEVRSITAYFENKEEAEANYKIINNAKDECYENKNDTNYTISCAQSQQPRTAPQAPPTAPGSPMQPEWAQ